MSDDDQHASALRPLRALEVLSEGPRSQAELADELGVHPRTIRRLLEALVASGYVDEADRQPGGFALTSRMAAIGNRAIQHHELPQTAAGHLDALADELGETTHLSVPGHDGMLTILFSIPARELSVRAAIGDLHDYATSAPGRAVLGSDPARLEAILHPDDPNRETPEHPADLLVSLTSVRDHGYAVVRDGEDGPLDVVSIAAPVRDARDQVVAALTASIPAARIADGAEAIGDRVVARARALSQELGSP